MTATCLIYYLNSYQFSWPNCYFCCYIFTSVQSLILFFCIFFFFFNGHTCNIWKFLGQGLNLSCSSNLHHNCGNALSLSQYARAGTESMPPIDNARSLTGFWNLEEAWETTAFLQTRARPRTWDDPLHLPFCCT